MRVLVDIRPWCEPNRSGVGTYAAELTKALLRRRDPGLEFLLYANGRGVRLPYDVPAEAERRVTRYPNKLLNASVALARRPRIETLAGRADAAFFPNFGFFSTTLPYAVTVHDLSFVHEPRFFSPKQRLWHALVRPAETLRRAAAFIAVSAHTKRDLTETFGVPPERITVASPAADPRFAPQPPESVAAMRSRLRLLRPYFLFLANVEPRKNVLGLLEAFALADVDLDLVIAGGFGYRGDEVRRAIARSPRRDRIRALGYVAEDDKPALYAGATAFVYPSFYEGFGMPVLEAMACGTPVVASRTSSLGEVVGDGGLLVDPRRPRDIADAMTAAATDPRLADELRARAHARAARYGWDASADAVAAALTGMVR